MGVHGLWPILKPAGEPLHQSDERLQGKVLAIDTSLWLYQFLRVPSNCASSKFTSSVPYTHTERLLVGFFQRICKVVHLGIRPIFVFDSTVNVPHLKYETLEKRRSLIAQKTDVISRKRRALIRSKLHDLIKQREADNEPHFSSIDLLPDSVASQTSDEGEEDQVYDFLEFEGGRIASNPNKIFRLIKLTPSDKEQDDIFDEVVIPLVMHDNISEALTTNATIQEVPLDSTLSQPDFDPQPLEHYSSKESELSDSILDSREAQQVIEASNFSSKAEAAALVEPAIVESVSLDVDALKAYEPRLTPPLSEEKDQLLIQGSLPLEPPSPVLNAELVERAVLEIINPAHLDLSVSTESSDDNQIMEEDNIVDNIVDNIGGLKADIEHEEKMIMRPDVDEIANVKLLLSAFGLPFIDSLCETDSQVAELINSGLIDGVITDDSDVFLYSTTEKFVVYKEFFKKSRDSLVYKMSKIKRSLKLDRPALVTMAIFLGCDFCLPLIKGIGPKTAYELAKILSTVGAAAEDEEDLQLCSSSIETEKKIIVARLNYLNERLQSALIDASEEKVMKKVWSIYQKLGRPTLNLPNEPLIEAFLKPLVSRVAPESLVWRVPSRQQVLSLLPKPFHVSAGKSMELLLKKLDAQIKDGTWKPTLG